MRFGSKLGVGLVMVAVWLGTACGAAGGEDSVELEELVVTAQKQEENAQEVPISMDVFTGEQIDDAGIRDISELTRFSPNVYSASSNAQNAIVIRGLSPFNNALFGPVGFFVDGMSYPSLFMHNPDLLDIERVEVLRGPQGTLYGRNTESGVINLITEKPGNELEGETFAEFAGFDAGGDLSPGWRVGGHINAPLIRDRLSVRLAGQWKAGDGYMTNIYNDDHEAGDIDHANLRGVARWTPAERWELSLTSHAMSNSDGKGYFRFLDGPYSTERNEIAYDGAYHLEEKGVDEVLNLHYDGTGYRLVSVTGWVNYEREFTQDFDSSPRPLGNSHFDYDDNLYSQELRLESPPDAKTLRWLLGLYGFGQDTDVTFNVESLKQDRQSDLEARGGAVFGQATYTLRERLHLTAGLRYELLDQEGEMNYQSTQGTSDFSKDQNDHELLPKGVLSFDLTDAAMLYASVAKGYLAGGYCYHFATGRDNFTYDPEHSWNYELGLKTSWLQDRLSVNLALFYIDVTDKQVVEYVPGSLGVQTVANAARAHSQGLELEVTARPVQGLELFAGLGYTDAVIDSWAGTQYNQTTGKWEDFDYDGHQLPNAPRCSYNVGAQYRHPTGLFGRIDLLGNGDSYADSANDIELDAYELINLRLGYDSDRYQVVLWCNNLLDKGYTTLALNWGGYTLAQDGDPRTLGAKVTFRF